MPGSNTETFACFFYYFGRQRNIMRTNYMYKRTNNIDRYITSLKKRVQKRIVRTTLDLFQILT